MASPDGHPPPNHQQSNGVSRHGSDAGTGIYSFAQRCLDRVVDASSRRRAYDYASSVASSRPVLFSFAVSQLLFSFLPLLLFVAFAAAAVAFALGAAILFALFWVGLALLVLVPALLVASSIALLVWCWALGSFLVARWLFAHAPVSVVARAEGTDDADGAGRSPVVKAENGHDVKVEQP